MIVMYINNELNVSFSASKAMLRETPLSLAPSVRWAALYLLSFALLHGNPSAQLAVDAQHISSSSIRPINPSDNKNKTIIQWQVAKEATPMPGWAF
jgi:hypothetical protein